MENSTSSFENFDHKEMPKNNMGLSIVGTILGICSPFCCPGLILGIIAIVFSTQVKKKFEAGDFAGSEKASKNAKLLALIAIVLGVIGIIYSAMNWDAQMEQIQQAIDQYNMNK